MVPNWCLSPSAGIARASLVLNGARHEDIAAFQCCDAALYEMSIQSTRRDNHPIRDLTVPENNKFFSILNFACVESESLYLVASHVVTLVHDERFTSLVVLSNIQTGLRSRISNLVQTQTQNNSKWLRNMSGLLYR